MSQYQMRLAAFRAELRAIVASGEAEQEAGIRAVAPDVGHEPLQWHRR